MPRSPVYALAAMAAAAIFAPSSHSQAVVSTRAGLVHFFEGTVYVAGQPLEARLGRFSYIQEGEELRTEKGRAEVLLTPGVFLRVGENSSIRMVSNSLADTRVELLKGSGELESGDPAPGTAVTILYKDWAIHPEMRGIYRIDADPARLIVRAGEAQVIAAGGEPVKVSQGMDLPFAAVLVPEQLSDASNDALADWADGRAQSISADNAIAADIQDPATMSSATDIYADGFTYYPMLGLSSYAYMPGYPYQAGLYGYTPGFYSMYLPGYASLPLFLRMMPGSALRPGITRIGVAPVRPITTVPVRPGLPVARPVTPAPIRPAAPIHVGGRR